MITHERNFWHEVAHTNYGAISLTIDNPDLEDNLNKSIQSKLTIYSKKIKTFLIQFSNPPLVGGVSAVFFGIIPFLHHQFFDPAGLLTP